MDDIATQSATMDWTSILYLALPIIGLVSIVWLFLHYGCKSSRAHHSHQGRQKSRDVLYISGYAAFIILEFIVYVCLGNAEHDKIVETISFGATLSSLIMSVVAIIFTIVSGKEGKEQLGRITQATVDLKKTSESISEFSRTAMNLSAMIDHIDSKLTSLEIKTSNYHKELISQFEKGHNPHEDITSDHSEEVVKNFIFVGSISGNMLMLNLVLSKQYRKEFNIEIMDSPNIAQQYCYGYLVASAASGIISYTGDWPKIKVTNVVDNLGNLLLDHFKNLINNNDTSNAEKIKVQVNKILKYYGHQAID